MACKLQANIISLEVEFPIEHNAHIPYGIRIKCEHLPSILSEEQKKPDSIQQLKADRRNSRWAQKSEADGGTDKTRRMR